jgi:excisionase family DNA binding protein
MPSKKPSLTNKFSSQEFKNLSSFIVKSSSALLDVNPNELALGGNKPLYCTITQAAKILHVSTKTLRRWDKAGKIRCIRTAGGHRRIPHSEVLRLQPPSHPAASSDEVPLGMPARPSTTALAPNDPENATIGALDDKGHQMREEVTTLLQQTDAETPRAVKAFKNQVKVLRILLTTPKIRTWLVLVCIWLCDLLTEVIAQAEELTDCRERWKQFQQAVQRCWLQYQEQALTQTLQQAHATHQPPVKGNEGHSAPTVPKKSPKQYTVGKKLLQARQQASNVFWNLFQAQHDAQRPKQEQQRAQALITKIITPYHRLTRLLAHHPPGTLVHDVCRLLLGYQPNDFALPHRTWSVRTLAQVCQQVFHTAAASKSSVHRVLKALQWYKKPRQRLLSPDSQYGEKMRQLAQIYLQLTPNDCLVVADEFAFTSRKIKEHVTPQYAPQGLQIRLKTAVKLYYKSFCAIQVLGLFAPLQNQLKTTELPQKTYKAFVAKLVPLLKKFLETCSGKVYLVLDNASYHCPAQFTQLLQVIFNERVVAVFLPTHAPELNPIEPLWNALLGAVERGGSTPEELRTAFRLALTRVSHHRASRPPKPLTLHCSVCGHTFEFTAEQRPLLPQQLEAHLCFTIPHLNPYVMQVLTHGLETSPLGL